MRSLGPGRGEVWLIDFDPIKGHEQAGVGPCVAVSASAFNRGPARLVVVIPMTTTDRGIPLHVRVDPPEGGIRRTSFVTCEAVRAVASERFIERWGMLAPRSLAAIEDRLRILLQL